LTNRKLIVWDTETGGLDPNKQSILTLGVVAWQDGSIADEMLLEIAEPEIIAEERALKINGISVAHLATVGDTPLAAVMKIKNFLLKNGFFKTVYVAGHNVPFDVGFIKRLYTLAGEDYDKTFSYRVLDTMTLALALDQVGRLPGLRSTGLDGLCSRFGINIRGSAARHNALEDARATAKLLTKLLDMVRDPHIVPAVSPGSFPGEGTNG
jgi:DNA polymerase-3 subunit epsilon